VKTKSHNNSIGALLVLPGTRYGTSIDYSPPMNSRILHVLVHVLLINSTDYSGDSS
jgi:hypothetical protein